MKARWHPSTSCQPALPDDLSLRIFVDALDVQEMHFQAAQLRLELRHPIDSPLRGSPVKAISPVVDDTSKNIGGHSVNP